MHSEKKVLFLLGLGNVHGKPSAGKQQHAWPHHSAPSHLPLFSSQRWPAFRQLPHVGRCSTAATKPHSVSFSLTSFMHSPLDGSHPLVQVAQCLPVRLFSLWCTAVLCTVSLCSTSQLRGQRLVTTLPLSASQLVDGKREWRKNNEAEKKGITRRNRIVSAPHTEDDSPQQLPRGLFQIHTHRPVHYLDESFPAWVHFNSNKAAA